jgi:hypothetical protein
LDFFEETKKLYSDLNFDVFSYNKPEGSPSMLDCNCSTPLQYHSVGIKDHGFLVMTAVISLHLLVTAILNVTNVTNSYYKVTSYIANTLLCSI